MGDDGASNTDLPEHVEARRPRGVIANLVDLIDGEGVGAESDRRRAGECDAPAQGQLLDQSLMHAGVAPVAKSIGRAARTREHVIRLAQPSKELLELRRRGPPPVPERSQGDFEAHVLPEVVGDPGDQVIGVWLEAEGRVKEDGGRSWVTDPRGQLLVDRRHRRTRLAGAENGDQTRRTGLRSVHSRNATQIESRGAVGSSQGKKKARASRPGLTTRRLVKP